MRALALLLCAVAVRAKPALDVSVDPAAGTYNVSINGQAWFPGGPTKVWAEGKLYSSVANAFALWSMSTTPAVQWRRVVKTVVSARGQSVARRAIDVYW